MNVMAGMAARGQAWEATITPGITWAVAMALYLGLTPPLFADGGSYKVSLSACYSSCESFDADGDGTFRPLAGNTTGDHWICDENCPQKIKANPCGPGMQKIDQIDQRTWECTPLP